MVHVDLVAIDTRLQFGSFPLARINPIARFGCVLFRIGNVYDFVRQIVGLFFARPRVHVRKGAILAQPRIDGFPCRHVLFGADILETFACCDALANDWLDSLCVVHQSIVAATPAVAVAALHWNGMM